RGVPPERLEVEYNPQRVILSWEHPSGAQQFRVWRASVNDERHTVEVNPLLAGILRVLRQVILPLNPQLYLPPLPEKLWVPGAYAEIGTATQCYFEDQTAVPGQHYLYYVRAEDGNGALSEPSNIVAVPSL